MRHSAKIVLALSFALLSGCASGGFRQVSVAAGYDGERDWGESWHSSLIAPLAIRYLLAVTEKPST